MRIIVHFGMHKTGSTSIQMTLAKNASHLTDIYYPRLSNASHNGALINAFSKKLRQIHKLKQISPAQLKKKNELSLAKLNNSLKLHQERDILLSSEVIATLTFDELHDLYSWLRTYTNDIIAVAYIRSPVTYLASAFQQQVKGGLKNNMDLNGCYPDYQHKIEKFDHIFGKENVHLWKFDPLNFPAGGVVGDFCQRLGIDISTDAMINVNEGLSLSAISLLYAYSKFGHGIGTGKSVKREYLLLIQTISQLRGEKLQFAPQLIQRTLQHHGTDIDWIETRLGASLAETTTTKKTAHLIKSEADLLKFSPQTLEWLALQLGEEYLNLWHPQMTAQQVAEWMHLLRLKLAQADKENTLKNVPKNRSINLTPLKASFKLQA